MNWCHFETASSGAGPRFLDMVHVVLFSRPIYRPLEPVKTLHVWALVEDSLGLSILSEFQLIDFSTVSALLSTNVY